MLRVKNKLCAFLVILLVVAVSAIPATHAGDTAFANETGSSSETIQEDQTTSTDQTASADGEVSTSQNPDENQQKTEYQTTTVQYEDFTEKIALKNLEWYLLRNDTLTIDEPSGTFSEYLVTKGQQVKAGDPLLTYRIPGDSIAVTEKKLQLERMTGNYQDILKQKQEEIKSNKQSLSRMEPDKLETQILEINIKKLEVAYDQYKYQTTKGMEGLKKEIEGLEAAMELQYLYAPYDGVVFTEDKIKEGTLLNPGTVLISIYDPKSAVLGVSAKEVNKLWYQQEVSITRVANMKEDTNNVYRGKVIASDSLYQGSAAAGMIYIQPENKEELVSTLQKANLIADCVTVEHVLVIPVGAVKSDKDNRYVYVLDETGVLRKQYITGRDNGSDFWVYNGLSEGQKIVTE